MKKSSSLLIIATICFTSTTGFAAKWETGVSGDWTSNHWEMAGAYPGELEAAESAVISGLDSEVKVKSNIPHSVGDLWVHNGATLEIGGDIISTMAKFGSYGEATTVNQTAGTFTLTGSGFHLGFSNDFTGGCVATFNLSGGRLSVDNIEAHSRIGTPTSESNVRMVISGSGEIELGVVFVTNATLEIRGGSSSLGAVSMFDPEPVGDVNAVILMNGTAGSLRAAKLNAYGGEQGTATLQYQLDANGVSPIEVTDLALNSEGSDAQFVIDATAWDGSSGLIDTDKLVLVKYKKLWSPFDDTAVTLKGITGSLLAEYDLGGGLKGIVLKVERKP